MLDASDVEATAKRSTKLSFSSPGEIVTTIPTIGFNVETVEYKNISFTVWGKSRMMSASVENEFFFLFKFQMLVAKTKSAHCGDIISRTHK